SRDLGGGMARSPSPRSLDFARDDTRLLRTARTFLPPRRPRQPGADDIGRAEESDHVAGVVDPRVAVGAMHLHAAYGLDHRLVRRRHQLRLLDDLARSLIRLSFILHPSSFIPHPSSL